MTLPFKDRLNIGETIERTTAKYIVEHLGADVEKIGSLKQTKYRSLLCQSQCKKGPYRGVKLVH